MVGDDLKLARVNVGDVQRLRFTVTKGGAAWDLSAASVVLKLRPPDGADGVAAAVLSRTMTKENAAGGVVYYDTLTTDLGTPGVWTMTVVVTDGAVVKTYPGEIAMRVEDRP